MPIYKCPQYSTERGHNDFVWWQWLTTVCVYVMGQMTGLANSSTVNAATVPALSAQALKKAISLAGIATVGTNTLLPTCCHGIWAHRVCGKKWYLLTCLNQQDMHVGWTAVGWWRPWMNNRALCKTKSQKSVCAHYCTLRPFAIETGRFTELPEEKILCYVILVRLKMKAISCFITHYVML